MIFVLREIFQKLLTSKQKKCEMAQLCEVQDK